MNATAGHTPAAVTWCDSHIRLLDQRFLPQREVYLDLYEVATVAQAIRDMVVRGAPAIGITAAYGAVLAARNRYQAAPNTWRSNVKEDLIQLAAARPTAVNLFWALNTLRTVMENLPDEDPTPSLLAAARYIHEADIAANRRMGELGAALFDGEGEVLTHCNAGALATGGYGTALGVIRSAYNAGRVSRVYADETRPWLQGARLTAWELTRDGIPVTLIADSAAAYLMASRRIQWVVVGADRIAANGDTANKIGTYHLAIAARHHGVRFMVVAPSSTVDLALAEGSLIPIEIRSPDEVLTLANQPIAASDAQAWNPSFDVTPATLIDAIVTERGVILAPNREKMAAVLG
ncbi:Methylthioribose-1-phosphate isomerase [Gammaproteobacteria bacterium]